MGCDHGDEQQHQLQERAWHAELSSRRTRGCSGQKSGIQGPQGVGSKKAWASSISFSTKHKDDSQELSSLLVWLPFFEHFSINIGFLSSSQLTNSDFSEVFFKNHQPVSSCLGHLRPHLFSRSGADLVRAPLLRTSIDPQGLSCVARFEGLPTPHCRMARQRWGR